MDIPEILPTWHLMTAHVMLNKNQLIILRVRYITSLLEEEFEDTEEVIRLGKSKDR